MSETEVRVTIGDLKSELRNDIYDTRREIKITHIVLAMVICVVATCNIVILASSLNALKTSADFVNLEGVWLLKSASLIAVWGCSAAMVGMLLLVGCIVIENNYRKEREALCVAMKKLDEINRTDSTVVSEEMIRGLFEDFV